MTLICMTCGYQARRDLSFVPGCRGVHETPNEVALCPKGHGPLLRKDVGTFRPVEVKAT